MLFILTLSRSISKVKVRCQSSRSHKEKCCQSGLCVDYNREIVKWQCAKNQKKCHLTYGFEIWPKQTTYMHELDVSLLWNNGFRHILNCYWCDSVKTIKFFCHFFPLSYLVDERQLTFFSKLQRILIILCCIGLLWRICPWLNMKFWN